MTLRSTLATCFIATVAIASFAAEASLPRHPAPSPDGSTIAFSWQGDLWIVPADGGAARRITAHPADERHPIWSKDGTAIAFSSNRHGNADIFIMPSDGSAAPSRLSYASVTDVPLDFTADGSAVLFSSNRAMGIRWMPQLWTVPVTGGTPAMLQDAFAEQAVFAPDGGSLLMVRGATKWTRRGYRGPANRELWISDTDGYRRLTDFSGDDDNPSWFDDETASFLSSRDGRKNVFTINTSTGETSALTAHTGSAVRFPRASADGSIIAYEFEDAIWTVPTDGGAPTPLRIEVPADQVVNSVQRRTAGDGASDLSISPDGKLAAFVIHGDVFVTDIVSEDDQKIAKPPTVQVTDTPQREQEPQWSPDGTKLIFSSARNGNFDLFSVERSDGETGWTDTFEFTTTPIATTPANEQGALFSPDEKHIAFVRGKGQLVVADLDGANEVVLHDHFYAPTFSCHPMVAGSPLHPKTSKRR